MAVAASLALSLFVDGVAVVAAVLRPQSVSDNTQAGRQTGGLPLAGPLSLALTSPGPPFELILRAGPEGEPLRGSEVGKC